MCSAAFVGGAPQASYVKTLGMPADRIFQGYDAVDNEFFHHMAATARARAAELAAQFKLPNRYFLVVARFIPKKNLPWLLETYAKYRRAVAEQQRRAKSGGHLQPWSLVLLGEGRERPALQQRISDLGLTPHVQLPGFITYHDLPAYYALAGALIHPSKTEPWGLVVNEAMAAGLPVLVSNACGCVSDLVRDGQTGFLFDPANSEQLVQLMLRVSTQPQHLPAVTKAAFELVSNWGLDRFANGLRAAADKACLVAPPHGRFWQGLLLQLLATKL